MRRIQERSVNETAVATLIAGGVHPLLARIFSARGVVCPSELELGLEAITPPTTMSNLDAAAHEIARAIQAGGRLLIVADYDADGATACAVAVRGLRRFGALVDFLVPDRFIFGYGLTPALVDHAVARDQENLKNPIDWIITVDNGISSVAGVARAKALGIKVLVTDHHLPGKVLPDTLIVNPNLRQCQFPSKHLAGVGVMFYVLLALRRVCRDELLWPADRIPQLADLLPIVALGTVADMVRLDANNRRLVAQGLERLRRGNSFAGLNALFQVANLNVRDASASNFGFAIGPRLNAAGRLGDMGIGIQCLIEDDPDRAMDLAQQLDAMNHERREIEQEARDEALSQALSLLESQSKTDRKSLVLHDSRWHPGVIGLVAGRLKEQFYRPAIVFADDTDPGRIKGSCRSIPGVHIRDILERIDTQYPGLILTFGGHAMAAGLALESARLDEFSTLFESTLADFAGPEQFLQQLDTDGPLDAQYLKLEFAQRLAAQVWGQGFAPPVFMNRFEVIAQRRLKERHLKLTVRLAPGSPKLEAIWFNAERDLDTQATLAYQLSINDWQGRSSLQLEVVAVA